MNPVFSVIIPAHNEEKYIKRCIRSVKRAAEYAGEETEIIVVCNRCTDRTEEIASEAGATAKALRNYGRTVGKTYTVLKKNYLLNSTRKQDELGDGLYFRLMAKNAGALIKASLGDPSELDGLLDKLFYDYNG